MSRFVFYDGGTSFSTKPDFTRSVHFTKCKNTQSWRQMLGLRSSASFFQSCSSALDVVPEVPSLLHEHIPNSKWGKSLNYDEEGQKIPLGKCEMDQLVVGRRKMFAGSPIFSTFLQRHCSQIKTSPLLCWFLTLSEIHTISGLDIWIYLELSGSIWIYLDISGYVMYYGA